MDKQTQQNPYLESVAEGNLERVASPAENLVAPLERVEGYDVDILTSVLES